MNHLSSTWEEYFANNLEDLLLLRLKLSARIPQHMFGIFDGGSDNKSQDLYLRTESWLTIVNAIEVIIGDWNLDGEEYCSDWCRGDGQESCS